jgi:GT2 family glycosyltransferase
MLSDDLLLCPGVIDSGLSAIQRSTAGGERIGGGALFYREYPRDESYHVKLLPGGIVHINHGFFNKAGLEAVGYADQEAFEFYGADGDLTMRLNTAGWRTIALEGCYAEHLQHRTRAWAELRERPNQSSVDADMALFYERWGFYASGEETFEIRRWSDPEKTAHMFWRISPLTCVEGVLKRLIVNAGWYQPDCSGVR